MSSSSSPHRSRSTGRRPITRSPRSARGRLRSSGSRTTRTRAPTPTCGAGPSTCRRSGCARSSRRSPTNGSRRSGRRSGSSRSRTAADNAQLLAAELRRMAERADAEARGRDHLLDERPTLLREVEEREAQARDGDARARARGHGPPRGRSSADRARGAAPGVRSGPRRGGPARGPGSVRCRAAPAARGAADRTLGRSNAVEDARSRVGRAGPTSGAVASGPTRTGRAARPPPTGSGGAIP